MLVFKACINELYLFENGYQLQILRKGVWGRAFPPKLWKQFETHLWFVMKIYFNDIYLLKNSTEIDTKNVKCKKKMVLKK